MTVSWYRRAERDRYRQLTYLAERNPMAAIAAGDAIQAATKQLAFLGLSGRPGRIPRTRELSGPRTPFILIYRVAGADISIVRLLHERQRWPRA